MQCNDSIQSHKFGCEVHKKNGTEGSLGNGEIASARAYHNQFEVNDTKTGVK